MSTIATLTITTNLEMVFFYFINLISVVSNLNFTLSIKLERGNYLIWKSQILPILRGHGLDGFVTGMKPCPNEFINVAGDSFGLNQMVNPNYFYRQRQDQLILGWMIASMSEGVVGQIVGCTTS